jgi:hypothetical protein
MIIFLLVQVERKERRLMGAAAADVNSILIEGCMHFVADVHRRSTIPVRLQWAMSVLVLQQISRLGSR